MRLHLIVEGQTEETFVNEILAIHLGDFNVATDARCVMTSKDRARTYRGGLSNYRKAKTDVTLWAKEDHSADARFSTMFDYYALPNDFPGYEEAQKVRDSYARVRIIEKAFRDDIDDYRFVPYIQLHEFEALLFTDIRQMDQAFVDHGSKIDDLVQIALANENPELINDQRTTAPSKRIIAAIPEYGSRKHSAGPLVASRIGIAAMRSKCQHFNEWVTQLERLGV